MSEILKKIIDFFEKIEFKVFGGGALCRVRPLGGAFVLHLTLADFGPRDSNKNGFCLGGSPPI